METSTFYIDTYGCKINQAESQAIREAWLKLGYAEAARPELADFIIINSCAITSHAERESRNALYRWKRQAPSAKIIYSGCAAQLIENFRPRKKAFWATPDYCIPHDRKSCLLSGPANFESPSALPFFPDLDNFTRGRPIVKIQDGCSQRCSYCIVPTTRGLPSSRDEQAILQECENLFRKGFSELVISGVNLRQYKHGKTGLWKLIRLLDRELGEKFQGKCRIRLSSLEPSLLTQDGLETLANSRMICRHLHLSLQHASPVILRAMGRGHYSAELILQSLEAIRSFWPVFGLGADVMAGFPGETEQDALCLSQFIGEAGFTYGHVFPFSARPGTIAAKLPDQLPAVEKKARAEAIRKKFSDQKTHFLKLMLQKEVIIIAPDSVKTGASCLHGVDEHYISCIFTNPVETQALHLAQPVEIIGETLKVHILD